MGFSRGFRQGKPGKALLELRQVCTSKIQVGQLDISKPFRICEDEKSVFSESIFLFGHRVFGAFAGNFEFSGFD
jgi:hypothetical protein